MKYVISCKSIIRQLNYFLNGCSMPSAEKQREGMGICQVISCSISTFHVQDI